MKKFYPFIISLFFISCNSKISYIGKALPPTSNIDVYIAESSVKQPFEYIGKGFIHGYFSNPQRLQSKAEQVGMTKGADAVLILDYVIPANGTSIVSVHKTDSIAKSAVTTSNTTITPTFINGYHIYYLKYNK